MALYKPCPRGEDCSVEGHEIGEHNAQLHVIETVFLIIFTLEVLLKLGALGGSFFRACSSSQMNFTHGFTFSRSCSRSAAFMAK